MELWCLYELFDYQYITIIILVLWEIFEYGALPYTEMTNEMVIKSVLRGYR